MTNSLKFPSAYFSRLAGSIISTVEFAFEKLRRPTENATVSTVKGPTTTSSYPVSTFRFSVEKQSHRSAEFMTNPEMVKAKILETVLEFFPSALVETHVEMAPFDNGFSTSYRNFFVIVTISDSSMPADEFGETVTYLQQAIRVL